MSAKTYAEQGTKPAPMILHDTIWMAGELLASYGLGVSAYYGFVPPFPVHDHDFTRFER